MLKLAGRVNSLAAKFSPRVRYPPRAHVAREQKPRAAICPAAAPPSRKPE
jgi:hypothetical protein